MDFKVEEIEIKCHMFSDFFAKQILDPQMELARRNEMAGLKGTIEKVRLEEAALLRDLKAVEAEREQAKEELENTQQEIVALDMKEEVYWKEYADYHMRLREFHQESCSVDAKAQYAKAQLERIKRTNVFNDAFHIWYDGHFGTINRFRLGRLPSIPVEWAEVNAAWGMTVLLLSTMATKLGFRYKGYNLVPCGSMSRLEKTDEASKELPLFVPGGVKIFWDSKFNSAMVAFLECVQQLKDYIEQCDPHFKLPYKIVKDKIGDTHGLLSIKYQLQSEEVWTKASKFLLTNFKWCLAWVCKQTTSSVA
jgi:beclin 1